MSKRNVLLSVVLVAAVLSAVSQTISVPLAQRIGHYNPAVDVHSTAHGGAGSLRHQNLVNTKYVTGNFDFVQRGVLDGHSSIAEHYHLTCEEMFIILDGEAQFTIDGRTSLIQGPAAVPNPLGHAHAIYNPGDKPLQWMAFETNVNAGLRPGCVTYNLGDQRVDVPLDPVPQFISVRFDRRLLHSVNAMDGGKGTVQYRRVLDPTCTTPRNQCRPAGTVGCK
jgi:mannose-6-phosphate isomerase-like protein (cupin superfamily)